MIANRRKKGDSMSVRGPLVMMCGLVMLLGGCSGEAPATWRDVLAQRGAAPAVLPSSVPPRLQDAWTSSMNHVPVTTFYSLNEPWVVICRDRPRTCRTKAGLSSARLVQRGRLHGRAFTVLVMRAGKPGYPSRLSPDLAKYWESVSFRSRPAWLQAKATDGAMTG